MKHVVALLALAACNGSEAFIGLTLTLDGELPAATVEAIDSLEVEVRGAEESSRTYPPSVFFLKNRNERIRYWPGAQSGELTFAVTARDADGLALAYGEGDATIDPNGPSYTTVLLLSTFFAEDLNLVFDLAMEALVGALPFPSHVVANFDPAAADLFANDIDTDLLRLNGQNPPPGVSFVVEGSVAVLKCKRWDVGSAVKVHGTRGLTVLAAGDVAINNVIDIAGNLSTPGPGGFAPGIGPGAGAPGNKSSTTNSSGGGAGGGYDTVGGTGGGINDPTVPVAAGGATYGSITALLGGSGGGAGGRVNNCGSPGSRGGGGGGVLQISSAVSISIAPGQGINAGGGGGSRGCLYNDGANATGGGGAGSGGQIFLEAPTVVHDGILAANGGGGGAGRGSSTGFGQNGQLSTVPAAGGTVGSNGGNGGAGGAFGAFAQNGVSAAQAGGGGGASGRIYIRTRPGGLTLRGASSPGAVLDSTVP